MADDAERTVVLTWNDGKQDNVEYDPETEDGFMIFLYRICTERFRVLLDATVSGESISNKDEFVPAPGTEVELETNPITSATVDVLNHLNHYADEILEALRQEEEESEALTREIPDVVPVIREGLARVDNFLPLEYSDSELLEDLEETEKQLSDEDDFLPDQRDQLVELFERANDEANHLLDQLGFLAERLEIAYDKVRNLQLELTDRLGTIADELEGSDKGKAYENLGSITDPLTEFLQLLGTLEDHGMVRLSLSLEEMEDYLQQRESIQQSIEPLNDLITSRDEDELVDFLREELIPTLDRLGDHLAMLAEPSEEGS